MSYIGVDLGTSSVKLLLIDGVGNILAKASRKYNVEYPKPGWSQQSPEDWLRETLEGLKELLQGQDAAAVAGLGIGGQMHGLVLLDKDDKVIRPAILWNDGRTGRQVEYLNETIGRKKLSECTANIAFAGFTAPKLLWVYENEPENYKQIDKIMLPKDYLVYMLTGVHATDMSDASGTLLLDVKNRKWSDEMCRICKVKPEWLPKLYESYEAVGLLKAECIAVKGLGEITVCAGAGDNAAAAVGTGTVGAGSCNISLGTSGTVFIASDKFGVDKYNALHSFAHADGKYHLMGCMLSAASCAGWWMGILESEDFPAEMEGLDETLGKNNIYFLPYLMGERSPLNDVNARGTFIGMTAGTKRQDMMQAVLEGVSFGLRDSIEVARSLGLSVTHSMVCGGGATNKLWLKILSNVLNIELTVPLVEEGPAMGSAMLAAVAAGEYACVGDAAKAIVRVKETIYPNAELVKAYEAKYRMFSEIYPALKECFCKMAEQGQ